MESATNLSKQIADLQAQLVTEQFKVEQYKEVNAQWANTNAQLRKQVKDFM